MNQQGQYAVTSPPGQVADPHDPDLPTISSEDLFAGFRELRIRHADSVYRLKITGSNKLILTK